MTSARVLIAVCLVGCGSHGGDSTSRERSSVGPDSAHDVTAFVELVGEPLRARYPSGDAAYARNVWDLQAWNGRLYLGHGNSSNIGPSPNAGPVDVWSYAPSTGFTVEYTADDEQIDHYSIIDDTLAIAGHDPRESWELGNFYRLESSGWRKHRTIWSGIHTYDLLWSGGALWAATGTPIGAIVQRSLDDGRTWSLLRTPGWRIYSLFELEGAVYASGDANGLYRFDGREMQPLPLARLVPGVSTEGREVVIVRSTRFNEGLAYLAGQITNDHQWLPLGLFAAPSAASARALALPNDAVAHDLEVLDGKLYVLASLGSQTRVYAANGLGSFREVLRFDAETFARSFAFLGRDLYFGLGCETTNLSPATGRILRVAGDRFR